MSPLAQGRGLKRETRLSDWALIWSPLAQGRGLKLVPERLWNCLDTVAPRTGAWIETPQVG